MRRLAMVVLVGSLLLAGCNGVTVRPAAPRTTPAPVWPKPATRTRPTPTPSATRTPRPTPLRTRRPTPKPANPMHDWSPGVRFRWLKAREFDCTYPGAVCWGILVIPRYGCPTNLYVEAQLYDRTGAIIGFTNATSGSLYPRQRARLVLDSLDHGVAGANLTRIDCY